MAKYNDIEYEFNPIKDQICNEQAQAVVWSTKSIERAVEAMRQGLPLKVNPFIGNNTKLIKPELVFKRTEEEIEEYVHCMQDICYFAEKCYVMTPEGLQRIKLRDYQVRYLKHLQKNRFSIYLACRQAGKSLTFFNNVIILLNINKLEQNINKKIKKYLHSKPKKCYFYINDNELIIDLPLFELINLVDNSIIGKLRYNLYKFIYKLEQWQEKRGKKELNQMMKVQDTMNIIKNNILNGQNNNV